MILTDSSLLEQDKAFTTAYSLRRHLHKTIIQHMSEFPEASPLDKAKHLPKFSAEKVEKIFTESDTPVTPYEFIWRICEIDDIGLNALSVLAIDHSVPPVQHNQRWFSSSLFSMERILQRKTQVIIPRTETNLNSTVQAASHRTSLWTYQPSPNFIRNICKTQLGHFMNNSTRQRSSLRLVGLPKDVEAFLDQIIVWRDLGFIHCSKVQNHHEFASIPEWAQKTLKEHEDDPRPYIYTFEEFENAETHDELWNAAQRQLRTDGMIHNYLRMLWGKKILEWTPTPEIAMEYMVALNDKWALDGRDPNTYTGIGWVLGKFDRGWTERPVYGKIRCMTTDSTKRKYRTKKYIETYSNSPTSQQTLFKNAKVNSTSVRYERRE